MNIFLQLRRSLIYLYYYKEWNFCYRQDHALLAEEYFSNTSEFINPIFEQIILLRTKFCSPCLTYLRKRIYFNFNYIIHCNLFSAVINSIFPRSFRSSDLIQITRLVIVLDQESQGLNTFVTCYAVISLIIVRARYLISTATWTSIFSLRYIEIHNVIWGQPFYIYGGLQNSLQMGFRFSYRYLKSFYEVLYL